MEGDGVQLLDMSVGDWVHFYPVSHVSKYIVSNISFEMEPYAFFLS